MSVEWVRRPLAFLEECERVYGDSFTVRLRPGQAIVMVSDPEAVREVFTGDPEILRSGEANRLLGAALGSYSLLLLDGREHLHERRLMLPPFHGERMRGYGELIAGVAQRSLRRWPAGRAFPVAPHTRAIALEVIMRAVFGVNEPARLVPLERALERLLKSITRPYRVLSLMLLEPDGPVVGAWRRHSLMMRRVDDLLLQEIGARRTEPDLAGRTDILSLLLEARDGDGNPMGDDHLRDELMTLLLAGHETTAASLAWALERLARRPELYERLRAEAHHGGDDLLDAVVKETLRIRPVIPFAVRRVMAPVEIAGHSLPAGVDVAPCIHLVHRRSDLYPDPAAFRPERFLERPSTTYGWIPFGGGTRRCLGGAFATFEMKTVLREIAQSGWIQPAAPESEGVGRRGLSLVPARGGRIVWRPGQPA
jgi:cytochrome P450 family 135